MPEQRKKKRGSVRKATNQGLDVAAVTIQVQYLARILINAEGDITETSRELYDGTDIEKILEQGAIGCYLIDTMELHVFEKEGQPPVIYDRRKDICVGPTFFRWDCSIQSAGELMRQFPTEAKKFVDMIRQGKGERLVLIPYGSSGYTFFACDPEDRVMPAPPGYVPRQRTAPPSAPAAPRAPSGGRALPKKSLN